MRLRELTDEIYDALAEMEDILEEVAPEELERARLIGWHTSWALLNQKDGWVEAS